MAVGVRVCGLCLCLCVVMSVCARWDRLVVVVVVVAAFALVEHESIRARRARVPNVWGPPEVRGQFVLILSRLSRRSDLEIPSRDRITNATVIDSQGCFFPRSFLLIPCVCFHHVFLFFH